MKRFLAFAIVAALAGCGPVSFVPGVRLGGTEVATPDSWDAVEVPEEVRLRADGGWLPRVVNIWAVKANDSLYVSGSKGSGWVERLLATPEMQLRIGDSVYALRATPIEAGEERVSVIRAYLAKYREQILEFTDGEEPDPEQNDPSRVVFRLDRA